MLEVILKGKERELAGLLIILRLWRLLKLVGGKTLLCHSVGLTLNGPFPAGVAVGAGEIGEDTIKELARVKGELGETRLALTQARDENQTLRDNVARLEAQANQA